MVAGECSQVIGIPGCDDAAAEPDRRRDDDGIDGVTRIEPVAVLEPAGPPRHRLPERDRSYAMSKQAVDRCIGGSATISLGKYGRGNPDWDSAPVSGIEDVPHSLGRLGVSLAIGEEF
ncbi:MAG: hypothetical protein ACRDOI_20965 [Trebonia sp.]